MPTTTFDVRIDQTGASYTVQAAAPSAVGDMPAQHFALPFDLADLPRQRRDAGEWVAQMRIKRMGPSEQRQARELGASLFGALFQGDILAGYRAMQARLLDGDLRLIFRLRLPGDLSLIPWELLYDPVVQEFLATHPRITLVRQPVIGKPVALRPRQGPLRMVVVLASPTDRDRHHPALKVDLERQIIEAALSEPCTDGRVQLEVIRGRDTRGQLSRRLREPIHVLHLFCHGDLNSATGEGELLFENVDGESDPINARLLRLLIERQSQQLRLLVLNACLAAVPVDNDPISSVGMAVLNAGVPAVLAMQFEWPEATATELSRALYEELAGGSSIESAIGEVRRSLAARFPDTLDWAVPVLFTLTEGQTLVEVPSSTATRAGDSATRADAITEALAKPQQHTDDSASSQKKQPSASGARRGLGEMIVASVFGILLLAFFGWNLWTKQERADAAFDQGLAHLKAGAYDLASDDFTRAINLDEKRVDAYYHRGLAYKGRAEQFSALGLAREAEEKFTAAVQDFSKAIDLGQVASEVFYNRGLAYAGQKKFAAAVGDLNRAIERGLRTAEVYYNRGLALAGTGERSAAIDDFTAAIGLRSVYAEAYYNRALSYVSTGQKNDARTDLEKVLTLTADLNLRRQAEEQLKAIGNP